MPNTTIYVEFLTVSHLIRGILPVLTRSPSYTRHLYIFDTTIMAFLLSRILGCLFGFKVERLVFKMAEVRDAQGACIALRVRYQDLKRLQELILQEAPIIRILQKYGDDTRLEAYLAKVPVITYDLYGYAKHSELGHALVMAGVVQWHKKEITAGLVHLYMYERPFWGALARYNQECDITVHNVGIFRLYRESFKKIWSLLKKVNPPLLLSLLKKSLPNAPQRVPGPVRMMAEYLGQFNLDHPERVSDLFFLDPQGIQGTDVCLVFNNMLDPVDSMKWEQLSNRGITAVARTVQTSLVDEAKVPVFRHQYQPYPVGDFPVSWQSYAAEYRKTRDYWDNLFRTHNIKLWASWYKYDPKHIAMADAINAMGGVSSIYQRSYESNPSPILAVGCDLIFGFSSQGHDIHLKSGSDFKYHITVGFIGDNRFEFLRPLAQKIRSQILGQGAKHIIAFFDDNTVPDGRWFMGDGLLREEFVFWLEKILQNRDLGIIFKPKIPGTLRQRLGPVADLLRTAEQTGRCYVFNEGVFHGSYPPAVASMAADIAIQNTLWAGTAGIEAALSGVKTLLIDKEGWPQSPLYKLGDNVVFKDWESTWRACHEHWNTPGGNPHFGDWSAMINELDPFRDGLAAQRMSRYLKEVLEGLRAGSRPEDIMEEVAERYAQRWGKDKVQRGPRK